MVGYGVNFLSNEKVFSSELGTLYFNNYIYRVIQTDGLSFVSPYFKIRTGDIYDVNYI
jgi:hypothetical protein